MSTDTQQATAKGWRADDSTFGARLALVRQRMSWGSVAEAAKECGLPTESWRTWERDGVIPRKIVTIAIAIATRTGCDPAWLLGGNELAPTREYFPSSGMRIVAAIGEQPSTAPNRTIYSQPTERSRHGRPVRQTRPLAGHAVRPHTPVAV